MCYNVQNSYALLFISNSEGPDKLSCFMASHNGFLIALDQVCMNRIKRSSDAIHKSNGGTLLVQGNF